MKLVITMSRRYGTGASVIAEELSKRLGIPVYDKVNVEQELSRNTYESEVEAIKGLAQKPCIILGRCASEILKDRLNVFNIYAQKIDANDRERSRYYHEHTGKAWGDVNNYHMILNTSDLGVENCADILMRYFEQKEYI